MPEHEDITGVGNLHESKCALYDASGNTIISSDGSEIFIAEQAAAAADVAGFGQIWISNATPNELWFTNDGGTDYEVALKNTGGILQLDTGIRQTFKPNSTNAGINVGSVAGDPSTPSDGDLWYDSTANELTARINGANVALGASSGATTALDNLASVAINTSLISDTDATDDLGSASIAWKRLYLQAGSATDIPVNIELASAHSANALNITTNGGTAGDVFKIAANGAVTLAAGSPYIYGDTTNQYVRLDAGAVFLNNGSTNYVELNGELKLRGGGNEVAFGNGNVRFSDNHLLLAEKTAPTGTANAATIYAEDNGAGKTRLMVIFGSGAAQQIAIEP